MEVNTEIPSSKSISSFLIFGIFILAFAIRIYHIDSPPLDFEPERQYHSFILARNYFLQSSDSVPEWRKKLWQETAAEEYVREPPILEHVVSLAYRITHKEQFWISRLLSVIFWLVGGWILFRLVRNLIGPEGAVFSLVFYLFNPFGILASRTFMPDPLMIFFTILAVSGLVQYHQNPSRSSCIWSAILTGTAALIKPFCLVPLLITFLFVTVEKDNKELRKIIVNAGQFLLGVSLIVLPYYLAGLLPENGFLRGYASQNFLPRLWFAPYFWGGWFDIIRMTVGYIPFIVGLFGILIAQKDTLRIVLLGLWAGYFSFGLLFSYSTHSQDYYHIILIPIVALSLGSIGDRLFKSLRASVDRKIYIWVLTAIIVFSIAASIHEARSRWKAVQDYIKTEVSSAIEIGEILNHSNDVISLASYYAKPLKYHAEIGGKRWPYGYDFRGNEIMGRENITTQARFQEDMKLYSPKYFVVSDLEELNRQQDLKKLLYDNFPVFKETKNYVIFSLTPVTR
ncbi:glycosyltransferase family 39 protein [bacterium]|nr:glycosyltransferase family 39 protein [bacterium]